MEFKRYQHVDIKLYPQSHSESQANFITQQQQQQQFIKTVLSDKHLKKSIQYLFSDYFF